MGALILESDENAPQAGPLNQDSDGAESRRIIESSRCAGGRAVRLRQFERRGTTTGAAALP
jgi:hypothetical protein